MRLKTLCHLSLLLTTSVSFVYADAAPSAVASKTTSKTDGALAKKVEELEKQIALLIEQQKEIKKEIKTAPEAKGQAASTVSVSKQELTALQKKVDTLEHKQKVDEKKLEQALQVEDAKINVVAAKTTSNWPKGFIDVPNTNTAIAFSGRVKIDGSYTTGPISDKAGAYLKPGGIPLMGGYAATTGGTFNQFNNEAKKSGHIGATAQGSRVAIDTISRTAKGDVKTFIKVDFYGAQNGGYFTTGNGGLLVQTSSNTNNSADYGVRLRQAVVAFQDWRVGQEESNFFDVEMGLYHLENFGVGVPPRRAQARWSPELATGLKLNLAVEKPNTDYVDMNGYTRGNESFGRSPTPDFTARLRYEGAWGFASISGIVRSLAVNMKAGDSYTGGLGTTSATTVYQDFNARRIGWGIGFGGQLHQPGDKSHLFIQANYGQGLGYLNQDGNASGYLQFYTTGGSTNTVSTRWAPAFQLIRVVNALVGYCHYWRDDFKTVLAGTYTAMKNPPLTNVLVGSQQINQNVQRVMASAVYSPVPSIDVGVEVMYGVRNTIAGTVQGQTSSTPNAVASPGATGRTTQITTSFTYRF